MTTLAAGAVREDSSSLSGLGSRVREAFAAELGRVVAAAVRDAVVAAALGRALAPHVRDPFHTPPHSGWVDERWDRPETDGWDESDDGWGEDRGDFDPPPPVSSSPAVAVGAGVAAGRWWARRGTPLAAAGVGLAVGVLGLAGGPLARTALAVLAAAADLLAAADALGRTTCHEYD